MWVCMNVFGCGHMYIVCIGCGHMGSYMQDVTS